MTETDPMNCGACGRSCDAPHSTNACSAGTCTLVACDPSFGDCDALAATGCEADFQTSAAHCGGCGRACPGASAPHTTASCAAGTCGFACAAGYADCDGTMTNGCETDITTTAACGACDRACAAGEVCVASACSTRRFTGATGPAWEVIAAGGGVTYPGYTDYTPAGSTAIYASTSESFARYDTGAASWTALTPPSPLFGVSGYFASPAWVGDSLYVLNATSVHRYDIATSTWTTPLIGAPASAGDTQNAHDDTGHVYAVTADNRIATYDVGTNTISYQPFGMSSPATYPRIAWDSVSRLLYLSPNITNSNVYSFDPATGAIRTLTPLPESHSTPTFCSDRSGHLYAAGNNNGTRIWQYRVATDTWTMIPDLPFDHDANGNCTVTDDGWLYVTNTGVNLARIRLM
jgi:outer membrane protein assembly factor BamB